MVNLLLWVLTIVGYSAVVLIGLEIAQKCTFRRTCQTIALIALLTLPVNISGHVLTIGGNAVGEKGVYSLFSLYQKTGGDAMTVIGISGYQQAEHDAAVGIGISGYQKAGHDAMTFIGISGYQQAEHDAVTVIGISGYQEAGHNAMTVVGLSFFQNVGELERWFGAFVPLSTPVPAK
ncbi:MAG: hypothetical protein Q8P36_01075 [bacterium]|nr:hypothetical protein [bacterium]